MRALRILVNCGETTCAWAPGKFCRFFGTRKYGTVPLCLLFTNPDAGYKESESAMPLKEKDGWIQRCKECLETEEVIKC